MSYRSPLALIVVLVSRNLPSIFVDDRGKSYTLGRYCVDPRPRYFEVDATRYDERGYKVRQVPIGPERVPSRAYNKISNRIG